MNLGQAYQGWQQQSQNRELYKNTREAFRKAWFALPTNKPCSYYTKEVLGQALAATREIESNKAKAASVMIHVLTFANWAEPKFNPKPDFTFHDLMEYTKGPLADPDKIGKKQEEDDTDLDIDPVTALPRKAMAQEDIDAIKVREHISVPELDLQRLETDTVPEPCDEHGNALSDDDNIDPLAGIDFPDETTNNTKTEEYMEQKKTRGKQPKPVAQLDAKTLQVIKVWPSRSEAERELGACNLDRAIARKRLSAGFFWCSPEDVGGFTPNPMSKFAPKSKMQPKPKAENIRAASVETAAVPQQPAQRPAEQQRTAVSDALAVFKDSELIDELKRRGWHGEFHLTVNVTI